MYNIILQNIYDILIIENTSFREFVLKNKKILLIRLSALGDVIFNLPLASILKSNGYHVTWLTSEKGFDIVNQNPLVDEVILVPYAKWKKQNFFKNLKSYLEILTYIRSQNFDIAIDTQGLLKTFIWTKFCGAKRTIVSKSAREGAVFGGTEVIEKLYTNWETHVTQDYLKFAKYIGLTTDNFEVRLPSVTNEVSEKIDNLLAGINNTKPIITICPATTWRTKHWKSQNWKELIEKLKREYTLVYTGMQKDNQLIEYISDGDCKYNLAGKTNLLELCEVFRRSNLVISLDSGSTHLAWATQVPKIVSIFCCTPKSRYAPLGAKDRYIALEGNLPCRPCHKKHCPNKKNKDLCRKYPSVEEVLNAIHKLLPIEESV